MSAGRPDRSSVIATNDAHVVSRVVTQVTPPCAEAVRDRHEHEQRDDRRDDLDLMSASQRLDFPWGPYPVVCTIEHRGKSEAVTQGR